MSTSRIQKLLDKKEQLKRAREEQLAAQEQQHREAQAQIDAQIKAIAAREKEKERAAETARKIEAGALALNHMRANQDSEFYRIMYRLINQNVPTFRRHLFTEFGIAPAPPKQSNAARKSDRASDPANSSSESTDPGELKSAFPSSS